LGCSCSASVLALLLIVLVGIVTYGLTLINTPDDTTVGPGVGFVGVLFLMAAVPLAVGALLWWLFAMHRRTREIGPFVLVLAVVVGVGSVLYWGPWRPPKVYYRPDTVGVVTVADQRPDGMEHVTIEDGRTFDLNDRNPNTQKMSMSGRYGSLDGEGGVEVGSLLLAGESPSPWYFATSPATTTDMADGSQPCYPIREPGRVVHQGQVWAVFGNGLKLRLNLPDRAYDDITDDFWFSLGGCVDKDGDVISFFPYA
jgi:hypothetical protein